MQKSGKVWGETSLLFGNENFHIHKAEAKAGSQCSKHKHIHRNNMFLVLEGKLRIRVWKNTYDLEDLTLLDKDDWVVVEAGEYHRFEATTDCEFLEIYFLDPVSNADIEREGVGRSALEIANEEIGHL